MSHSDGVALQIHVEEAKKLKTAATLTPLISKVLAASDVYVFGELLALQH